MNQWFDSFLIYTSTSVILVSDITAAKSLQTKSRANLLSITMNMRILLYFRGNKKEMDVASSFSSKHVNNKASFYVRSYLHLSLSLLKSSTLRISVNTALEVYYSMKNLTAKFLFNFNKNIL